MTRLGTALTTHDFPLAELHALRLDGQLVAIDDAFMPIDQPDGPSQRAAALAQLCQHRLIAEQRTAAWIWGASESPPSRHELCASIGARTRPSEARRMVVREVVVGDEELRTLSGVAVTAPLRTAIDLARFQSSFDAELVARLLAIANLNVDDCVRELRRRRNLPRKKLALARFASL